MRQQPAPVTPPDPSDKSLKDFAGNIQRCLQDLYVVDHFHKVAATAPKTGDGTGLPADIIAVDDGTNVYLMVRTSRGWFKTANLTQV